MTAGPLLLTTAWGLASAVAVGVVGSIALTGGKARPPGALAFGLFGILWGLQIVVANVLNLATGPDIATTLALLLLVSLLPLPYFLLEFSAAQLPRSSRGALWVPLRIIPFILGVGAALVLLVAPDLLFVRIAPGPVLSAEWGPLYAPLVIVPHFLAFGVAVLALHRATRDAPTERVASRSLILLCGIGVYVAYISANNLSFYLLDWDESAAIRIPFVGVFTAVLGAAVVVAVRLWRDAATRSLPAEAARRRAAGAAILLPAAWGAGEGVLEATALPYLHSVGLWRVIGVAVITYGVVRWRVWDLHARARAAAARAAGLTAAGTGGVVAYGVTDSLAVGLAAPGLAALLVTGISLLPGLRIARRWLAGDPPHLKPSDEDAHRYGQRLDSYRAALEASLARDSLEEDRAFLDGLRERFGLSEQEHQVLLHYARSSVLVPRPGGGDDAFERLRLLGEGGAGRTWLARERSRDRLVVLKEPLERWQRDPAVRDGVLREARMAARVRHPNVARIEAVVEGKQSPILVMEYCEGGSLAGLLRARGTLPWQDAVALARDIALGVEAIHAEGILHRDLKSSNILLDAHGTPMVADFGIAVRAAGETEWEPTQGQAGTWAFMAPEARSGGPVDERTDVYGCAAILHECLYGAPPAADTPVVLRPDIPPWLGAVVARGLAPRPEDRFESAAAFAEACARGSSR